ncbi:TIGR03943 family putative permease subunit [Bacillus weihaiensis]|uniref:TIGR03943 family protein n=1 Tax=Bacillus weihaiensis TaxID=1547283 RepID=A0A1L3MU22_9BACI|nr:TIGR03943 family protein [Bacillus weihaiensis]APH05832.1 TIGR03943 family protein [Bacillus weihaiensis]
MILQKRQAIKAIILLLFASFIFFLHQSGEITQFIHPDYLSFSQLASVLFFILFFFQVPRIFKPLDAEVDHSLCGPFGCNHEEEANSLSVVVSIGIISIPLLTGFMMPYKTFGADEALKRGIQYSNLDHKHVGEFEITNAAVNHLMSQKVILFDHTSFADNMSVLSKYPEVFEGKTIEMEGFIAEDTQMATNQKVLTRFQVTHCVADANASGFVLANSNEFVLMKNMWVHIKGTLKMKEDNQQFIPVIHIDSVKRINTPEDPYIFS